MMAILKILALLGIILAVKAQINTPPGSKVATWGTNTTLVCEVTDPAKYMEWTEYNSNPVGVVIFSTDTDVSDPLKYEIHGTYNLMIKDLDFQDGGLYGCKVQGMPSPERADVVIIEHPEAYSDPLYEGETGMIGCRAKYKSAPHSDINEDHIPKLEGYIYDDNKMTDFELIDNTDYYEVRMSINFTANMGDNGKNLSCRIYTIDPPYEAISTHTLDVLYPVQNLEFAPINGFYYVGEYINCTADGNPAATYEWMAIESPGPAPVYQSTLNIVSTMIGTNTWRCIARNTAREPVAIEGDITFDVYPPEDGGEEGGVGPPPTTAWVIPVAILVPLIIIGAIVLGVFFWKKRMAASPQKSKTPQSNPNFESSIEESPSTPTDKGKPPPSMQPRPPPQSMAPNPGYSNHPAGRLGYVPPQQQNGRSPGYADLGIKHIPAYAQPPSLNSSMEHSLGPSPNGMHGANLNPNPYSRAPIVMTSPGNPVMASRNHGRNMSLSGSQQSLGGETGV